MAGPFEAAVYLQRIGLTDTPPCDLDGLRRLHHAHFFTIPFENFDIQLGRGIDLDPDRVFDKLVRHRRGGYCFELNGLFLRALRVFGFEARPLLARVHLGGEPSGRTHQLSLVELDGASWVVDVGFGAGGPRAPLPLEEGAEAAGPFWGYRLQRREPWGWLLQSLEGGDWKDSYSFDLGWVCDADIEVGNHYTSTSPNTHFTRNRVASRPTEDGRISLRDFTLTELSEGAATESTVADDPSYLEVLRSRLGIDLDASYDALRRCHP